ncbi:hypothetical protein AHAS_Ahas05G0109100 [Arachis hypogaea]
MHMRSIYHCSKSLSKSAPTVRGQQLSRIFTGHCAMHHDTIERRWMAHLICCLFERESECHSLRPFEGSSFHRLIYHLHVGGVIIHELEPGCRGEQRLLGKTKTTWISLSGGRTLASSYLPNYMHTLMCVTQ